MDEYLLFLEVKLMKCKRIMIVISAVGIALLSGMSNEVVFAQENSTNYPGRGRRPPPPKEAFDACADVEKGGGCSFVAPYRNLAGSCQTKFDGFVCVPDGAPFHQRARATSERSLENEE